MDPKVGKVNPVTAPVIETFVEQKPVVRRGKHYYFEDVLNCEMCGDPTGKHPLLGQRLNTSQGLKPWAREGISVSVKRCTKCKLIYASPMPIPANIQDHYGIPPESYWEANRLEWNPGYF